MADVYDVITNRIVEQLESGVIPWRKTWSSGAHGWRPRNLTSNRAYNGCNVFLLACAHQLHHECLAQLRTDSCPVCRSRLTNLSKDLEDQIRTRQIQDTTERNEEELQNAIARLGQGMNVIVSPFLMSFFQAPGAPGVFGDRAAVPRAWTPLFSSYPASISLSDIFEDFVVRQNTTTSSQPE